MTLDATVSRDPTASAHVPETGLVDQPQDGRRCQSGDPAGSRRPCQRRREDREPEHAAAQAAVQSEQGPVREPVLAGQHRLGEDAEHDQPCGRHRQLTLSPELGAR